VPRHRFVVAFLQREIFGVLAKTQKKKEKKKLTSTPPSFLSPRTPKVPHVLPRPSPHINPRWGLVLPRLHRPRDPHR